MLSNLLIVSFIILVLYFLYKVFRIKNPKFSTALVMKGFHFALVRPKRIENYTINYDMQFDISCMYEIGTDQKDWNKLVGITENFEKPHHITMMIAWRYRLDGVIEIAPYQHDFKMYPKNPLNRKMWDTDKSMIREVAIDEIFNVQIIDHISHWEVLFNDEVLLFCEKTVTKNKISWRILHWMGGNIAATKDTIIKYYDKG